MTVYTNSVYGTPGNDTLTGVASADNYFEGGLGNDALYGGKGTDAAGYARASGSVVVNLDLGTATGADGNDTFTSIENVVGSAYNDAITGNGGYNELDGGGGNDTITAGDGDDTLIGGAGDDALYGGKGSDTANFSGNFADYTISFNAGSGLLSVADKTSGRDGADVLNSVESLKFADTTKSAESLGVVADTTPPSVSSFSTADEATGVLVTDNIVVTFNEAIQRGTGSIVLKTTSGTTVATYDAAASGNLSLSGSTLTINPTADLGYSTGYKVEFAPGTIKDLAGNNYAGTTSYNFTTAAYLNHSPTGSVGVTGTPTQGQTLTASNTLADADGLGTISYQWKAGGSDITGATAGSFVLTEAQVGKTITVTASYTDGHGAAESMASTATTAVANVNDAPTGLVTISGTSTQGQMLTASNTLADADGLGTISYQWKAGGSDIASEIASTFVLTEAQVGKTVTVTASYADGHGTAENVTSSATAAAVNVNDAPTGSVTISGTPTQGQTLTASNTLADADGLGTITYLWQLGGGSSWTSIGSGSTLTLFESQVGKQIRVLASYTDGHGTSEVVASAITTAVLGYKAGTAAGDALAGTPYADTLLGLAGNDTLTGGGGNDTIDGGIGTDIAVYSGNESDYSIARNADSGYTVSDRRVFILPGGEGSDSVTDVERLQFSDKNLALDLTGNAGTVAKILGAVFGANALANKQYVGIGLGYIDGGMSYQDLMQLALNVRLGAGFTTDAEVTLLFQNLLGMTAGPADLSYWGGAITSHQFSQASLAVMAADTSINAANINLAGLAQTGIEFS